MKVVIDGRQDTGGVGRYIREITRGLVKKGWEVVLVIDGSTPLLPPLAGYEGQVKVVEIPRVLHWLVWEQVQLPWLLRRLNPDVYHAAGNWGVPLFSSCPVVVTIHDIIPLILTEYFNRSKWPLVSRRLYWWRIRIGLGKARVVMCDSEETKRQIMIKFGVGEEKLRVVPLAVSREFFCNSNSKCNKGDNEILRGLGIKKPYILSHGGIDRRKNNDKLIRAFAIAREKDKKIRVMNLVIAGEGETKKELMTLAERLGAKDQVIFPGWMMGKRMAILVRNAGVVVYPTSAEGFGMPMVEAMAAGVPVVASDNPVLRENGGDVPVYVNPESVESIAEGIDEAVRVSVSGRVKTGMDRAREFTWERTVAGVEKAYSEAIG
jgi:glycosyltransferase involved in cell wall biosynthesis